MSADLPLCPSCNSKQIVKNGKIHNGKQNYKCPLSRSICQKSTEQNYQSVDQRFNR